MATRKLSPEELQAVSRLAKQWGKIVVKHAFGEQGPGLDVDFAQMEEVAGAAVRGLTEGALEAATAQQGQLLGEQQAALGRQGGGGQQVFGGGQGQRRPGQVETGAAFLAQALQIKGVGPVGGQGVAAGAKRLSPW